MVGITRNYSDSSNGSSTTHSTAVSKHSIASSAHTQSINGRAPVSFSLTDHIAQTGLGKKPTRASVLPPRRNLDESSDEDDLESDVEHEEQEQQHVELPRIVIDTVDGTTPAATRARGLSYSLPCSVSPLHSLMTSGTRRPSLSLSTTSVQPVLYTTTDGKAMLPGDRYRRDPYAVSVLTSATSPVPSSTGSNKGSSVSCLAAVASPMSVGVATPMSTSHMDCAWTTASSHQQQQTLSAAATPTPAGCYYATVRFKKGSAVYVSDFNLGEGEYVLVEADRGEHIGVVTSVTRRAPKYNVVSRVIRGADTQDITRLNRLRLKEETSLATVRIHVQKLSVNLHVTDTEFQLDGKKLTIYYQSSAPADFRKLQRRLHSKFKCRIWLMPVEEAVDM